jgi:hypothetical protein
MSQFWQLSEIDDFLDRLISLAFPGWDFCLHSRFANYLELRPDQVLRIFLKNRLRLDRELPQYLSGPLEPEPLALDLQKLPADFQLCLLDRLLYARYSLSLLRRYTELSGLDNPTFRMPNLLLLVCIHYYRRDEVCRWLSSGSLPNVIRLAPDLTVVP